MAISYPQQGLSALALAAVCSLSIPSGAERCSVYAIGGAVRYKLDGTDPTDSNGAVLADTEASGLALELTDAETMRLARFTQFLGESPEISILYRVVT